MDYKEFPTGYFSDSKTLKLPTPQELDKTLAKFRRHLVKFIKELPQNARILDAGCGSGKVSSMVRIYRPDVEIHGVDISDVGNLLPPWINFKKASIEDVAMIYPKDYFDAIISLHLIEHLIYPMNMINAFKEILKPKGKVFFETPNWTRLFIPFSPMFFYNDYTHIRPFSSFGINKLLSESGFTPTKILSCSSSSFFVKGDVNFISKVKNSNIKKEKIYVVKSRSKIIQTFKNILRRLISPFLFDILIAVAEKE